MFIHCVYLTNGQINKAEIDKLVMNEMIRQDLPGMAIGVYQNGKMYTNGYGYLDLQRKKPITKYTIFRWASISKTLTAVAALQLAERRADFKLSDRVVEHYPHWTAKVWDDRTRVLQKYGSNNTKKTYKETPDKKRKDSITINQLLTRRSGINHYSKGKKKKYWEYPYKNKSKDRPKTYNADATVDIFRIARLDFEPGTDYLYTTFGYNLLGAIIDKKTGSYPKWVENNIKRKLDLKSLRIATGTANGFQRPVDGIIKEKRIGSKVWVLPGGGWESNIQDLLKFGVGIAEKKLLRKTSDIWEDDKNHPQKYRRGIEEYYKINNIERIYHGGTHNNLKTFLFILPSNSTVIAVMIPVQNANPKNIAWSISTQMGIKTRSYSSNFPAVKCNDDMKSSSRKFIGLWRKSNTYSILRRGLERDAFKKEYDFLRKNGYYLSNFSTEIYNNKIVWNGIFKKGGGSFAMWRGYDLKGFNGKWREMNAKGYRLYDLETYVENGKRKYAGLFKKGTGRYAMFRNMSTTAFGSKRKELAKQGLKLIDIEVYESNGALKWSGVWTSGIDGLLNRNYSYTNFKKLIEDRNQKGYKLIDIETYKANGKRLWAGIWEKNNQTQYVSSPDIYCNTMDDLYKYNIKKYELIDVVSY